jgi:hypothetical protein
MNVVQRLNTNPKRISAAFLHGHPFKQFDALFFQNSEVLMSAKQRFPFGQW